MPTALNLNLWSLIFCDSVFNCHAIFLYIHSSTLLISSLIVSLRKSSMPLSSSLLSADELNFIFTEKQDAITDHTQAHSVVSSHLVHLGIFALPSFEAKCTICISDLGQHLHLWVKPHPSAIKGMIAVTVPLLRCIIIFLSILCLSHHIHMLLFSLIKSKQNNEKQKFIHYLFWLPLCIPFTANPFQSNVYLLAPISLLLFSLDFHLPLFIYFLILFYF